MDGPPGMMGGGFREVGPPGMMGPPPGMQGGRAGGPERNDRMIQMLKAMDANNNGKLESGEIPEYRRNFVSMIVTRMGGDPTKTVDLAALERRARSESPGSNSRTSGGSRGTATEEPPLVPAFGEGAEAEPAPVLAFGKKTPEEKAAVKKSVPEQIARTTDAVQQSARELMNKFDRNKNGFLDKDKGEYSKTLPFDPEAADKDRDGRVSMREMIAALGGQTGVSSGYMGITFKSSVPYDRLPEGVPDWFLEADQDQDGQMTMEEYPNVKQWKGKPWSREMAQEFNFLDLNGDGIVTLVECFAVLKRIDEEKARKADAEKRQQERLKGGDATTTAAPAPADSKAPPPPDANAQATGTPPPTGKEGQTPEAEPPSGAQTPTATPQNAPYSSGTQGSRGSRGNRDRGSDQSGRGSRRGYQDGNRNR